MGYYGAGGSGGGFPEQQFLPFSNGVTSFWTPVAGVWVASATSGRPPNNTRIYNSSAANGDAVEQALRVQTDGSYACRIRTFTDASYAIMEVLGDGVSKGTFDCYHATVSDNIWTTEFSLGALTRNTAFTLKIAVNGKTGSNYQIELSELHLYRTA